MPRARRLALALLITLATPLAAQEFTPPDQRTPQPAATAGGGVRFGLLGFSTRGGGQINSDEQGVVGSTVDIATLGHPQVRLRPSFEAGVGGGGAQSLHISLEVVYRFQPEGAAAIPYVGAGLGWYDTSARTTTWPNLVMGFELAFRPQFNWLVEYHSLDRMGRHRFLIGLATRSGER